MSQTEIENYVPPRREYSARWYQENKVRLRELRKNRYQKNKPFIIAQTMAWAAANREKVNAASSERRKANPEKFREAVRRSYQKHKAKIAVHKKRYLKENKHISMAAFHKRRALKAKATIDASGIKEFVARIYGMQLATCYYCKRQISKREIHFDHIIPLSKGGLHSLGNLCVSCVACNCRKSYKLIGEWIVNGQQLFPI